MGRIQVNSALAHQLMGAGAGVFVLTLIRVIVDALTRGSTDESPFIGLGIILFFAGSWWADRVRRSMNAANQAGG